MLVYTPHLKVLKHSCFMGTYKTKQICNSEGHICRREGTLQLQLDGISTVLSAIAAATIAPMKYEELNREVRTARSLGCPSSPIIADPAMIQKTMPSPRSIRAIIYIATTKTLEPCKRYGTMENIPFWAKPCMIAPATIIKDPSITDHRRPYLWLRYGAIGTPKIEPSW
jgi:hypothetical protein